jgi:phage gp36-like protein
LSYVTPQEMITLFEEQELIEATNLREGSAQTINVDRLQAACDGAQGIIDGWLMRRYNLPLVDAPPHFVQALKIHAANIARNQLDGGTEEVRKKYEDAIAWLKWFCENDAIGDTTPGVSESEKSGSINFEMVESTWNADRVGRLFGC